jgi:hypothetical protein
MRVGAKGVSHMCVNLQVNAKLAPQYVHGVHGKCNWRNESGQTRIELVQNDAAAHRARAY